MRKYFNKLYLSIALVVLSLLTMVATTYAWVGLLTSTTFDEFTINLQKNDSPEASEYGVEVSLDGIEFADTIDQTKLRRVVLNNLGYNVTNFNDNRVDEVIRQHRMDQVTTTRFGNRIGKFHNMISEETSNYFWFDLYLAVYKIGVKVEDMTEEESNKKLDLYLRDYILSSSTPTNTSGIYEYTLFNSVTYPTANPLGNDILGNPGGIALGSTIDGKVKLDISNSCRLALEKYVPADKGHPEHYTDGTISGDIHSDLLIYQNGSINPTYNPYTGVYDFGGILPDGYNFAREYFNSLHVDNLLGSVPEAAINRGDLVYNDDGYVNHVIDSTDNVTIKKMARFRVFFWFEGWDSDCFDIIDSKVVTLNLQFSTKSPLED